MMAIVLAQRALARLEKECVDYRDQVLLRCVEHITDITRNLRRDAARRYLVEAIDQLREAEVMLQLVAQATDLAVEPVTPEPNDPPIFFGGDKIVWGDAEKDDHYADNSTD